MCSQCYKRFNLMSRTNETRHIKWHETCKCKCRLDASVCNNKQRWNNDKCRCECKELIDKGVCDKGYARNSSNCECECESSVIINKHLHGMVLWVLSYENLPLYFHCIFLFLFLCIYHRHHHHHHHHHHKKVCFQNLYSLDLQFFSIFYYNFFKVDYHLA